MNTDEKKAFLLLLSVIFHNHGLDEEEVELLTSKAKEIDGLEEMHWANEFIAKDYLSSFDRAREYLNQVFPKMNRKKRLKYLKEVWKANLTKGFITEMEARAMIKLAKDWGIDIQLMDEVKQIT